MSAFADEILDSCEASGTKIGINMARRGCEAVKNECFSDGNSRIRARLAAHGSLAGEYNSVFGEILSTFVCLSILCFGHSASVKVMCFSILNGSLFFLFRFGR